MENGLDILITDLQSLKGRAFWQQLIAITKRKEFKEIEPGIFSALGSENADIERLLDAAHKAKACGYSVYILPNPKTVSSADFIFKHKNSYKLYELKTILGKNSIGNRLSEGARQSSRILLNLVVHCSPRLLAFEIARFFRENNEAKEVLVFFKRRKISITKVTNPDILWRTLLKHTTSNTGRQNDP